MFTPRQATGTASRFLRRGLRGSALDIVKGIGAVGSRGVSMLEVGGGVGQIQIALIESGIAASAINVELSSSWENAAAGLLAERGLEGRVQRIAGDFVEKADSLPQADIVVLHRVLCCYPDWKAMLAAAVATANHVIALTFPMDRWWNRIGISMGNLICRIRGQSFRGYVHRPEPMIGLVMNGGFAIVQDLQGRIWRTVIASRDIGLNLVSRPNAPGEKP